MINIRTALESDVAAIHDLFMVVYGDHYAHHAFCEIDYLKRLVFDDDAVVLVAEDSESGRVLGTGSVILDVGAFGDLTGEFGRLVVHPDAGHRGIGKRLMAGRLERVQERLHLALVENRAVHPFSQRISAAYEFVAVGFLPSKLRFAERENIALYARPLGSCLSLRKNHPRIIPEAYPLADRVLHDFGIGADVIVDEGTPAYPPSSPFDLEAMTSTGYATLLHFERGRVRNREILGPVKLHAGLFQLRVSRYQYLLARREGRLVGGVGFHIEPQEESARILELVTADPEPARFLLEEAVRACGEEGRAKYIEADVNAHAPAMQRTLLELGFLPAAYIPAMSFHRVERLDVIRMVKLLAPLTLSGDSLHETTRPIAAIVVRAFQGREIIPRIAAAVPCSALFEGFTEEQATRLASICSLANFRAGEPLVRREKADGRAFLLLSGEAEVTVGGSREPVGSVGQGETAGELSLVSEDHPHTADITAIGNVEAAILDHENLSRLVRQRPDIGVIIYRNLTRQLGAKLLRADRNLVHRPSWR